MANQSRVLKNVAFDLDFFIYKNDGTIIANPGGLAGRIVCAAHTTGAATDNAPTCIDSTGGSCRITLAQAETNSDYVSVKCSSTDSGAVPFTCALYPAAAAEPTAADINAQCDTAISDAALATAAALAIVDGIVDTITGHITADYGSTEKTCIDLLDDSAGGLADIHTDVGTAITNIGDVHATDLPAVKTVVDAVKMQTDKFAFTTANKVDSRAFTVDDKTGYSGTATNMVAAAPNAAAVNAACDTAIADAALATTATLATVDGKVDSVLADTNELQTDWANGGRLDLILDGAGGGESGLDAAGVRTAIGMASANLDTQIGALGGGAGAIAWDGYTLTESDGTPIADADVWITTDGAGANVVASARTDAFGVPRAPSGSLLYLDPGTYSVWADKVGWSFPNPDTVTVVAP